MLRPLQNTVFEIGCCRVRSLMKRLGLFVRTKRRFVITTDSRHNLPVAENRLDRQFQPFVKNQVWKSHITYLWTVVVFWKGLEAVKILSSYRDIM